MTEILFTLRETERQRYMAYLAEHGKDIHARYVGSTEEALHTLADRSVKTDVLVLDNELDRAFDFITELRKSYPRLIIVLVDEDVDFATPGQADDISTEPFANDDLLRRVQKLMSERKLETIRADAMPPVREFANLLRKAVGELGKQQAALSVCLSLGFEFAAFYKVEREQPVELSLAAQEGLSLNAPTTATGDDVVGWVMQTGHSRVVTNNDGIAHPLVNSGALNSLVCASVGTTSRYGVIAAGNRAANSISQQQALMLELICAQLAATLAKE